jgi:hypothetical protein
MKREGERMEQVREIEYLGTIMPPINTNPHLYLRVMWIHSLGHAGGSNVWWEYCVEDYYDTLWLTGL